MTNTHPSPFGGRSIYNLRFADIDQKRGGSNGELQDLTYRLVDRVTAYGMEVTQKRARS